MGNEWLEVEFAKVLLGGTRNGIYKPKEFHGSGFPIVNMGELFAYPRMREVEMKRVRLTNDEIEKSRLQDGDLIFARRSLTAEGAGKCSIIMRTKEPTTFESSIIRARIDPGKADSLFYYYYFNSLQGKNALDSIRRQVAVAGITGTDLQELAVIVPPLPTQKAIAHILGTIDDKIELLRSMNETLEAMARALFKSWFIDFDPVRKKAEGLPTGLPPEIEKLFPDSFMNSELGAIPKGWLVEELGSAIDINPLRSVSKGTESTYLEMKNLPQQGMSPTGWEKKSYEGGAKFRNGDTLLARITPCLENGKTCFVQFLRESEIAFGSTEYIVLSGKNEIPSEWCYLLARDEAFRDYAVSNMNGSSGRQRVERDAIARYKVALPDDKGIFAFFKGSVDGLFKSVHSHFLEVITLQKLRDSLLPKLISGELELSDMVISKIMESANERGTDRS